VCSSHSCIIQLYCYILNGFAHSHSNLKCSVTFAARPTFYNYVVVMFIFSAITLFVCLWGWQELVAIGNPISLQMEKVLSYCLYNFCSKSRIFLSFAGCMILLCHAITIYIFHFCVTYLADFSHVSILCYLLFEFGFL